MGIACHSVNSRSTSGVVRPEPNTNNAIATPTAAPIAMYSIFIFNDKWQERDVPNVPNDAQLVPDASSARLLYGARVVDDAEDFSLSCRCSG